MSSLTNSYVSGKVFALLGHATVGDLDMTTMYSKLVDKRVYWYNTTTYVQFQLNDSGRKYQWVALG